jgi:hypothetical protein
MNEDKIRRQILETPYKVQDVCPTRKFKAPEDTLRRIQKKIAFLERRAALSLDKGGTADSIQNENLRLSEEASPLSTKENDDSWVDEFRKRYKTGNFEKNTGTQWHTASDIFRQVAHVYSIEMNTKHSCMLKTHKLHKYIK